MFDDGLREPPKVEREDERAHARAGHMVRTVAEAYMLFKKGLRPVTEFEVVPGVRATKGRRRAEIAVREWPAAGAGGAGLGGEHRQQQQ